MRRHWVSLADSSKIAAGLERELSQELVAGHPLYELPVRAVHRSEANDDVLFAIDDGTHRVAVVHLTWRSAPEVLPWPETIFWESLDAWAKLT